MKHRKRKERIAIIALILSIGLLGWLCDWFKGSPMGQTTRVRSGGEG